MQGKAITHFAVISCLTLAACTPLPRQPVTPNNGNSEQTLAPFTNIVVNGPINVIATQRPTTSMRVVNNSKAAGTIIANVEKDTLYLRSMQTMPLPGSSIPYVYLNARTIQRIIYNGSGTFTATNINTPQLTLTVNSGQAIKLAGSHIGLRQLTVFGATPISIKGINSPLLDVTAEHAANITLEGVAGLRNLTYSGPGIFKMQWVNSPQMNIQSHHGQIQLAGITHHLDTTISNDAHLDARYLRAKDVHVNTADKSRADIWAKGNLNAFATGSSNIYYYQTPRLLTKYMRQQGSVLQIHKALPCKKSMCDLAAG